MPESKFLRFDKYVVHKDQVVMIEQINHMRIRVTTTAVTNGENISFETNCEFGRIANELSMYIQSAGRQPQPNDE